MLRSLALQTLEDRSTIWDVLVIGGGATGLGTAVDAASRGYKTLLVEQHDFAKATSSRSTKLVHGGVRYLKQGNVRLVLDALRERGRLLRNAPHLAHPLEFVIPAYSVFSRPFYGIGLHLYDALGGSERLEASRWLSRAETIERLPTLSQKDLRGGTRYIDGQFDDARLAINLAQTVFDHGGIAVNYAPVVRLVRENERVRGAIARDALTGTEHEVRARVVVNATGVFCDSIRQLDEPGKARLVTASQGSHIVLPREFLPKDSALMIPRTDDGRVLFAIPWHEVVVVGTTDLGVPAPSLDPVPMEQEIEFILKTAARYLTVPPTREDILSVYAGVRPLVKASGSAKTSTLSRDHTIEVSASGLVTITGGKWTTYRKMAEDTVARAITVGQLTPSPCVTGNLRVHAAVDEPQSNPDLAWYGSDVSAIQQLMTDMPALRNKLHPALPYLDAQVLWAARAEMAQTIEDVLARRTRAVILDARAAMEAAPRVAMLLASALEKDETWEEQQVLQFREFAQQHVLSSPQ